MDRPVGQGKLDAKAAVLRQTLEALGSVMVAYSGGTDSAYLAWAAHQALGARALAVIADSASLPRTELAAALAFARGEGMAVRVVATDELEKESYRRNDQRRCFHCKDTLFGAMEALRGELGFGYLAFGMNMDDRGEFRPGQEAAADHHAVAPLVTAGLHKAEIRELARTAGLRVWDKPASACLASRIEYGRPVTAEALGQVELAEEALHAMGFPQVRVRHHGEMARVEIARGDLPRALKMEVLDRMDRALKAVGFVYVAVDAAGYRSGSMNAVLRQEDLVVIGQTAGKPVGEGLDR